MHPPVLPNEILQQIASYLSKEDVRKCTLVSRAWYYAFKQALYHSIHIANRRALVRFLGTARQYHCGSLVKNLSLDDSVGLTRDELNTLPLRLPILETLHFAPRLWKHLRYTPALTLWRRLRTLPAMELRPELTMQLMHGLGHQLKNLSLGGELIHELKQAGQFEALLSLVPNLTQIKLGGRRATQDKHISKVQVCMSDLESIHTLLPHLEDLCLEDVSLVMAGGKAASYDFSTLDYARHKTTALKRLHIQGSIAHYGWLFYVAHKYSLLEELDLDVQWQKAYKQSMTSQDNQRAKEGLLLIAQRCQLLDKVRMGAFCANMQANKAFFDTLKSQPTHIDALAMASPPYTYTKSSMSDFEAMLRCSQNKLSTLRIRLWRDMQSIAKIMVPLRQCRQLAELEMSCTHYATAWNYGCELDTILSHCSELKVLKLSLASLVLSKTAKANMAKGSLATEPKNYALEHLELDQVHFRAEVFDYLAQHCPNLKVLKLRRCVKEFDGSSEIRIVMPHHKLQSVELNHVHLRPSDLAQKCYADAAILSLTQKQRTRTQTPRWYHLEEREKSQRRLVRLGAKQVEAIEHYDMTDDDWDELEDAGERVSYRTSEDLEADIPFGRVTLICNDIASMSFNSIRI